MKFVYLILFLFTYTNALSQTYSVTGKIIEEHDTSVESVEINLWQKDGIKISAVPGKDGNFLIQHIDTGFYYISIIKYGYEGHYDSFLLRNHNVNLGIIHLRPIVHILSEVSIVEKVLAMVQKDDTIEYNSGAFKVNPDADAADLIRKMPAVEISNQIIKIQGEDVLKVVVDGKPFFGNDPYAALKNLPADIVDKVQVYNAKSDQEQFTGFSEGNTTKTINIITKTDKRNGVFGKAFGGYGEGIDNKYGTGASLNQFKGEQRITFTGQSNNVNIQNFSSDNGQNSGSGGGAGITTNNAAGINYSDKWGKKVDVAVSYFFNESSNNSSYNLRKTYISALDSGQVYNENNPATRQNQSHRLTTRLTYKIDSMNSILLQPGFSINKNDGNSLRQGFTEEDTMQVNQTVNNNVSSTMGFSLSNNLLFRHKFPKKGKTFSLSITTNDNNNNGATIHTAQNVYYTSPSLNDTINQKTLQKQNTWNLACNATYTQPSGKNGLLKFEYNVSWIPAQSNRNTNDFSYYSNTYSLPDNLYSNSFYSNNIAHKAGSSYLFRPGRYEFSFGLNYQFTALRNDQSLPVSYTLNHNFENLLPAVTIKYKFSKTKYLQFNYGTATQAPAVTQLQNVVNNNDPLHLSTGNSSLKQPYSHNITMHYNSIGKNAKNNFSVSITSIFTQHYITLNSIIADSNTLIQNILLPKGSQLTKPENIDGYSSYSANINYGLPLNIIKCRLNLNMNTELNNIPVIINNVVNYQDNKNGGLGISISSNINENIDFLVSSNINISSNSNSINRQLNNTYINGKDRVSLNIITWKEIVFNTLLDYQSNSGLSVGYNSNYLVWNMSIGKKIFKKHQGDIRLSFFDLLNENNSIQHTVTGTYIQDVHGNILQRYFLVVFNYKISNFKK